MNPDHIDAYSPAQFCRAYSLGTTRFYDLIKQGELRAVKAGRRTLVLKSDAEAWAKSLAPVRRAP